MDFLVKHLSVVIVLLLILFAGNHALAEEPIFPFQFEEQRIREPLRSATPIGSWWQADSKGRMFFYPTSGSQQLAQLVRFDPRTKTHKVFRSPKINEIWAMTRDSDGDLYFGGRGNALYRYSPAKDEVDLVAELPGANFVRALAISPQGKVYCGNIKDKEKIIYVYDPQTDKVNIIGPPEADARDGYVSALAWTGEGKLLVALGFPVALHLFDPSSGSWQPQLLEGKHLESSMIGSFVLCKSAIVAQLITPNSLIALNRKTGEIIGELKPPSGAREISHSRIVDKNGNLWLSAAPLPGFFLYDGGHEDYEHVILDNAVSWNRAPEALKYSMDMNFVISESTGFRATDPVKRYPLNVEKLPIDIFSVGADPFGNVYAEAYQWMHVTQLDFENGSYEDLGYINPGSTGEIYNYQPYKDKMLIMSYTHGKIFEYDPRSLFNPGNETTSNPRLICQFDKDIYRPARSCIGPKGKVWVNGPCGYGVNGYGLGWLIPETGEHRSWQLGTHSQSLTTAPPDHVALVINSKVHLVDIHTDEMIDEPIARGYSAITTSPNGNIIAAGTCGVEELEVPSGAVLRSYDFQNAGVNHVFLSRGDCIILACKDGIYGLARVSGATELLFREPNPRSSQIAYVTLDCYGNLVLGVGKDVVRLRRQR